MSESEKNEAPAGELSPVETVRYWADEFAKDPQRMAGGMIVKLLNEYAALREQTYDMALLPGAAPAGDAAMPVLAYAYDDPEGGWFEGMPCKRFDGVPPGRARNSEPLISQSAALAALVAKDVEIARLTAERDTARNLVDDYMHERDAMAAQVGALRKPSGEIRLIAECTTEDLVNFHALVYGRCKIWNFNLTDAHQAEWRWSAYAWWKAMHNSHRGSPKYPGSWSIYAGDHGHTGCGDAEITHFMRMPSTPAGAGEGWV